MSEKVTKSKRNIGRKKKDSWTIDELQMWLTSVFDVQGDDWYPNEEQWVKIVDMIFKLKEVQPVKKIVQPHPNPNFAQRPNIHEGNGHAFRQPMPPQMQQMPPVQPLASDFTDSLLLPVANDPIPPNADNLDELRRQANNGNIAQAPKVIKSANFDSFNK